MNNIDPNEVKKFDDLSDHWWNPEGELRTLHQINPLRLHYIMQHCVLANKNILDVGCGGGILAESMSAAGGRVTGIDMSANALNAARLHAKGQSFSLEYAQSTVEEWRLTHAAQYDVITCLELLEHVPDPASVIRACAGLLKPGGSLFLSTINRNPKSYLFAIVGAEYLLKLLPKNTHDFAKFIRPSELATLGRTAELLVVDITGIQYHLLTKEYSLGPDISVNYVMHLRKQN